MDIQYSNTLINFIFVHFWIIYFQRVSLLILSLSHCISFPLLQLPQLTAQGWLQVSPSCSFWLNSIRFPPPPAPRNTSRKTARIMFPKSFQIKSKAPCFSERGWAGHGYSPSVMAESPSLEKRHAFLPSLRELCLFLAFTVCYTTERHAHTIFFRHFSTLTIAAQASLKHSTPQRGNMSSVSPHIALKRPQVSWGTSALPLLIDLLRPCIHLSTYLSVSPVFMPHRLSFLLIH